MDMAATIFTQSGFGVFAGGKAARKHPKYLFFFEPWGKKESGFSHFVKTPTWQPGYLDNLGWIGI